MDPSSPPTTEVQDTTPIELPAADVAIDDDGRVDPDLAAVALDGNDYSLAIAAYFATYGKVKAVVDRQTEAAGRFNRATGELGSLLAARTRLQAELISATRRRDKADARLAATRAKLQNLAVDQYMRGGMGAEPESTFDIARAGDAGRQRVLIESVHRDQLLDQRLTLQVRDEQQATVDTTTAELEQVQTRVRTQEANRDTAAADRDQAERERQVLLPELARAKQGVADARITADVKGLDFTLVVFNAYVRAAKTMAIEQPACGIRWTALAGIGRTESKHGTFDGATVDANGDETKPIYGIMLNGDGGTAVIGDTDAGELDGTADGDRASGPMQFIPGTWRAVQRDGNGDGTADPQNYYDAALTAAVYLCRKGPGLDTDEGLRRGFRSYNNDDSYVELVLRRSKFYDRLVLPKAPAASPDDPFRVPLPTTTSTTKPPATKSPTAAAPTTATTTPRPRAAN